LIGATQEDVNAQFADDEVRIAAPVVFQTKQAERDPVTLKKKREGTVVVFGGALLYIRAMGFGARDIMALTPDEVTVERINTVLDGQEGPGLRISNRAGKPLFALAIAPGDPGARAAVRDGIYEALAGR
jgi:hypothetical protein